ncbi:hypothetical protein SAMN05444278_101427 [Psychroflexus salarius]|uniref:Histidyl-tRNA synthetase n=1 Tax=Psychroflexus salarius TaxID=1155689 RepID=A0A1M4T125_9FLAO|nr:DUF6495 family protein [Psychroflexus salarius]SHE37957.1 hypothetical protein SAMN05444278_101427 [Psychroflexus salarius]
MKYERLTKEQFEEMHQEFINFLATQSITASEWEEIKTTKPQVAEQELDVFSDLVWEGVLNNVKYLEHFSPQQLFLFQFTETDINLIAIKIDNQAVDITTTEGYQWLRKNLMNDDVDIFTSTKPIGEERNTDIFALIRKGANITKGELYTYFEELVDNN